MVGKFVIYFGICKPTKNVLIHFMFLGPVPISDEKYEDVVHLTKFCSNLQAKDYFLSLLHDDEARKKREKLRDNKKKRAE